MVVLRLCLAQLLCICIQVQIYKHIRRVLLKHEFIQCVLNMNVHASTLLLQQDMYLHQLHQLLSCDRRSIQMMCGSVLQC